MHFIAPSSENNYFPLRVIALLVAVVVLVVVIAVCTKHNLIPVQRSGKHSYSKINLNINEQKFYREKEYSQRIRNCKVKLGL